MGFLTTNLLGAIDLGLWLIFLKISLVYMRNRAWCHPDKLKKFYLIDMEGFPKWFPFHKYDPSRDIQLFMFRVRLATLLGALLILGLGLLTALGLLGIIK